MSDVPTAPAAEALPEDGRSAAAFAAEARVRALETYAILDTPPEREFDQIVRLARRLFDAPIVLVSFVAADRQFFKARHGVDMCGSSLEGSFCRYTVMAKEMLIVPDAEADERFRTSPFVTDAPHMRFYAGMPLATPEGVPIGSLCIGDVVPRAGFSDEEKEGLADLAALVMERMEARRAAIAEADGRKRFEAVASASVDAIICADDVNRIISWNGAAERMFGYAASEAIGQSLSMIVPPSMRPMHEAGLARAASGQPTKLVGSLVKVSAIRRDGTEFPIELSLSHWTEGGLHRFGAIARDITERLAAEALLKKAADFDALTDLANRSLLARSLAKASEDQQGAALILIDLDGFKEVNDSLGHAAGDEVLKEVARRLRAAAGEGILVSRLGGDEFVAFLAGAADPRAASRLSRRLIAEIEKPIEIGERSVYVGAGAGIALAAGGTWNGDGLIADADLALYRAKAEGKSKIRLFTPDLRPMAASRVSVGSGLRQAWERNEFELYYQPQVRLCDRAIVGAEALIRWNHPEQGVVAPGAFLPVLETSLLAVPLSSWILRTACAQVAAWRHMGFGPLRMGVNLFAVQFRRDDLPRLVAKALAACRLPAEALELEITENIVLRNETRITTCLRELREMGVGIAFDDYGTGYASLTMLQDFPVTRLKIDRSFVSGVGCGDRSLAVVEAISRLARGFELDVIAEGIETVEQADIMQRHAAEGQGYLFGRPMPAAAFERLLLASRNGAESAVA